MEAKDMIANVGMPSGANLADLLSLIKGSSTSSTSSSNINTAGIQQILNQLLSGSSGLGAIASGIKSSGGYNSTTQTLLTNDLLTRAAGEAGRLSAGTTTTNNKTAKLGGSDLLSLLAVSGGKKLLGPSVSGLNSKFGLDSAGDKLAELFGLGGSTAAASSGLGSTLSASLGAAPGLSSMLGSSVLGSLGDNILSGFGGKGIDLAGSASSSISSAADIADATDIGVGLTDVGSEVAGETIGNGLFPGAFTAANFITGGALGSTVGDVAGLFGDLFGNLGSIFD